MEGTRVAGRRPFGFDGGARACRTTHQFRGRVRGPLVLERNGATERRSTFPPLHPRGCGDGGAPKVDTVR